MGGGKTEAEGNDEEDSAFVGGSVHGDVESVQDAMVERDDAK